jgi:uncharacterized protein DUF3618
MAQTVGQIEAHIDRTRHELGANLKELEHRVEAATDWRRHFRARPLAFMGAGFVAGAVIGAMVPNGGGRHRRPPAARRNHQTKAADDGAGTDMSSYLKDAVMAFTASLLRLYINDLVSRSRAIKRPDIR